MDFKQKNRIDHIFQFFEYDQLSDDEHSLIVSFEEQYLRRGTLSERQIEILEDIFQKVA